MKFSPSSISDLPDTPAVYAIYGGYGKHTHVAYVGNTSNLKRRIKQHLVSRDGGVSTNTSAVSLNADYVTEVRWWRNQAFRNPQKRRAAELVAIEVLSPVLRTRDLTSNAAREFFADEGFRSAIGSVFEGDPTGYLILPTLRGALERITELEERVLKLEKPSGSSPNRVLRRRKPTRTPTS